MFRKIKKTAILLGGLCAALSLTKDPVLGKKGGCRC